MTVGRIPWSKAMQYGAYFGLEEPMLSHFWTIVASMDGGYLEWMKNEHDRHSRMNKPKKGKAGSGRYSRT